MRIAGPGAPARIAAGLSLPVGGCQVPGNEKNAPNSPCRSAATASRMRVKVLPLYATMVPPPPIRQRQGFPEGCGQPVGTIRATAAEAALMIPDAFATRGDYADLKMPLVIISGDQDRLVDIDAQSARLHKAVAESTFRRVCGVGHMVHQTAPGAIMAAIDEAAAARREIDLLPRAA
jgi:pimeloyl-ACP methyl ester carboxylesterase